jgi:hypothetical protein
MLLPRDAQLSLYDDWRSGLEQGACRHNARMSVYSVLYDWLVGCMGR